ncbi:hypothetical protein AVEN_69701-1 [Araneus ventricosus]|uniref:Uncharacterized protein n=1 Tax=Araneus ventricosus TaxID=182803 RepID=A0A4Y2RMT1_ARAVE|nr:hypothetical protein AVEN_205490-1 [Araneus ventricosus]GBN76285.1 hypothetical protein AVEN_29759-1 [Araneus ventricosus]GBN76569.1 hypothetical protein AVEN_208754-1 [Araneus ventricosus]GBN76622.1 hypothetical protein AVEN_69701-1 [Araneus ventricosus]
MGLNGLVCYSQVPIIRVDPDRQQLGLCGLHNKIEEKNSVLYIEGPGATIHFKGNRKDQTALTRLASGHLKTLRFSRGDKKFNIYPKCNMIEATPQHLLDCVALVHDDLLKRPDFVLEVMNSNDLMDLIRFRSEGLEKKTIVLESLSSTLVRQYAV